MPKTPLTKHPQSFTIPLVGDVSITNPVKIIGIGILLVLLMMGIILYRIFILPTQTLHSIVSTFEKVHSFKASLTFPESPITIDALLSDVPNALTQFTIHMPIDTKTASNPLAVNLLIGKNDTYTNFQIDKADQFLSNLSMQFPGIENLDSYKTFKPILTESQWIHMDTTPEKEPKKLSENDQKKLNASFQKTLIMKNFDSSFRYANKNATKISLGFDKKKLLEFMDLWKKLDVDMKSDIETMTRIVTNVDRWNEPLIEIIADQQHYPLAITISMPSSLPAVIKEQVRQSDDARTNPIMQNLTNQILGFLPKGADTPTTKLTTIVLADYNVDKKITKPSHLVEATTLTAVIQKDLPVLMLAFMGDTSALPKPLPTPAPVRRAAPTATPVPGARGSKEWEDRIMREWQDAGFPLPKNEDEFNFYAPMFCEKYPQECQ